MNSFIIDLLIGAVLFAVSIFVYIYSRPFPYEARLFLDVIIPSLMVLIIVYVLQTWFKIKRRHIVVGHVDDVEDKDNKSTQTKGCHYIPVAKTAIALAAYILILIPLVGFMLATIITIFSLLALHGVRSKKILIGVTVILPLILLIVFRVFLKVPLPAGILSN